jgi:putative ABC transport system substrate-binding protein
MTRILDRRTFVAAAGAFLAVPFVVAAQPARKVRIGYLSANPPGDTEQAMKAFRAKLRDLGWVDGENLTVESRYADGKLDRLPLLAADLVRLGVDLIFVYGTSAARAAKTATSTVPIVFGAVSNPLVAHLVASLTRPGGNVTGVTSNNPELSAKRVSLLKEVVPAATRIAVLANPDFPTTKETVAETRRGAQALGMPVQVFEARAPAQLAPAFTAMAKGKVSGVIVLVDTMFIANQRTIADLALSHRIPSVYHLSDFVEVGGLISYGAEYPDMFQQSAVLVDKVLRGARPMDLPVEQPWRYSLAINVKTAQALGLTIPQSLAVRADHAVQ